MFVNAKHEEGFQLIRSGDYQLALDSLNQALSQNPGHPDILSDRGVVYIHLNIKDKCLEDFELAVELQPEYGFRYAARAYAKERFGDLQGAVTDYEEAIRLDPEDAVSYNNLGLLQEKMGYWQQAQNNFRRADDLAKQEEHLFQVMDELENNEDSDTSRHSISPEIEREKQISAFDEFKKVFTSKAQFKQFLRFLINGFKIK